MQLAYNTNKYKNHEGVFEINGHRLLTGDATNQIDVTLLCGGIKPALVICDPPYGISAPDSDWDIFKNMDDYLEFTSKWVTCILNVTGSGALYIWSTQKQQTVYHVWNLLKDFKDLQFQRELVLGMNKVSSEQKTWPLDEQRCLYYTIRGYDKFYRQETDLRKSVSFGKAEERNRLAASNWCRHDITSVWFKDSEHVSKCNLAMQKPIKALRRIISASSDPGDIVLDVFCHSGSTLIASHETNRICYTMDINNLYTIIAMERYLEVSSQKNLF